MQPSLNPKYAMSPLRHSVADEQQPHAEHVPG